MSAVLPATSPSHTFPYFVETCPMERVSRSDLAMVGAVPAISRATLSREETRILRLLSTCGAQPAIDLGERDHDVTGITLIGREAGCPQPEMIAGCLEHLSAAQLIWVSPTPLDDPGRYEVLDCILHEHCDPYLTEHAEACSVRLTAHGERWCSEAFGSPQV